MISPFLVLRFGFRTSILLGCVLALQPPVCADIARDNLVKALGEYRLFRTLHCVFRTTVSFPPEGIRNASEMQEFWSDGDKYRILDQPDNALKMPGMAWDVRWNGERFQRFNISGSVLSTSVHQSLGFYVAQPQVLVPFSFLNGGAESGYSMVTLSDLRSDQSLKRLQAVHAVGQDSSQAEFPGGKIFGANYTCRIFFGRSPSFLPIKIQKIYSNGNILDDLKISYQPVKCDGGLVYLPSETVETSRKPDQQITAIAINKVVLIELNKQIPAEIFTMDYLRARTVIDLDVRWRTEHLAGATTVPSRTGSPTPGPSNEELKLVIVADPASDFKWSLAEAICAMLAVVGGVVTIAVWLTKLGHESK